MSKYFVGGIPMRATEDDVRAEFNKYGTVRDVVLSRERTTNKPRGFGFVQFVDKVELIPPGQNSVSGQFSVCGRQVEIKFATPRTEEEARETGVPFDQSKLTSREHSNANTNTSTKSIDWDKCLVIYGFPSDATSTDLYSYFSCFGHVNSVEISKELKNMAFVVFQDASLVDMIVQEARGNNLTMGGSILKAQAGREYHQTKVPLPPPPTTTSSSSSLHYRPPRSPPPEPVYPPVSSHNHPPPPPPSTHHIVVPMMTTHEAADRHNKMELQPPPYPSQPLYAIVPVTVLPPMHPSLNQYIRIVHWSPRLEEAIQQHLETDVVGRSVSPPAKRNKK